MSAQSETPRTDDPMDNWLMKPALEWLENAEHLEDNERCRMIASLLRDLWRQRERQLSAPGAGLSYSDIRKIFAEETGFDIDSQGCDLFGFAKAIEKAALRAPQADAIAALRADLAYYQAKWENELSTVSKLERERDALREEVSRLTENQRQQDSATAFVMERDEKERDALRKEVEEYKSEYFRVHNLKMDAIEARLAAERELAACREERDIWFDYIDPFDMYPEHHDLWHTRKAEIDARGAK